eukprot:11651278-Prorocentrum_lima.AAC.1
MLSSERKACQPLRIRSWSVGAEADGDAAGANEAEGPVTCSCIRPGGSCSNRGNDSTVGGNYIKL